MSKDKFVRETLAHYENLECAKFYRSSYRYDGDNLWQEFYFAVDGPILKLQGWHDGSSESFGIFVKGNSNYDDMYKAHCSNVDTGIVGSINPGCISVDEFWEPENTSLNSDKSMQNDKPAPSCDCGVEKVYGKMSGGHSDWCSLVRDGA